MHKSLLLNQEIKALDFSSQTITLQFHDFIGIKHLFSMFKKHNANFLKLNIFRLNKKSKYSHLYYFTIFKNNKKINFDYIKNTINLINKIIMCNFLT